MWRRRRSSRLRLRRRAFFWSSTSWGRCTGPASTDCGTVRAFADAVRRAGGARRGADLAALNLAAPLVDGVQVLVPARSAPGTPPAASPSDGAVPTGPISLSSATIEELDELPGVGPITAQKIVDYRAEHGPFASVDDLDAVPGIGPTRIEQLRDLVTP